MSTYSALVNWIYATQGPSRFVKDTKPIRTPYVSGRISEVRIGIRYLETPGAQVGGRLTPKTNFSVNAPEGTGSPAKQPFLFRRELPYTVRGSY